MSLRYAVTYEAQVVAARPVVDYPTEVEAQAHAAELVAVGTGHVVVFAWDAP